MNAYDKPLDLARRSVPPLGDGYEPLGVPELRYGPEWAAVLAIIAVGEQLEQLVGLMREAKT